MFPFAAKGANCFGVDIHENIAKKAEIIFKNNIKYIIIGIGINLNNSPNIPNYCTSYLNKYSKKNIKKLELIKELKRNFEKKIENFI